MGARAFVRRELAAIVYVARFALLVALVRLARLDVRLRQRGRS